MACQGTVETTTHEGAYAYLLIHHLDVRLALAESLQITMRVFLDAILSADKVLWYLGTFGFITLHLLSAGGRHSSDVVELLLLIERLKELHTKVQGMISSPHLSMKLLSNVLRQWSLYLNRYMAVSASESLEAPGGASPSHSSQS